MDDKRIKMIKAAHFIEIKIRGEGALDFRRVTHGNCKNPRYSFFTSSKYAIQPYQPVGINHDLTAEEITLSNKEKDFIVRGLNEGCHVFAGGRCFIFIPFEELSRLFEKSTVIKIN